ncbi:MAG: AbgT family transporter [Verrucomicrobiota bacterium]
MPQDIDPAPAPERRNGLLDRIEKVGNRLPHPMSLFVIGAIVVLVLSQVAAALGWSAELATMKPDATGEMVEQTEVIKAKGMLAGDGAFWAIDNLVVNFTDFAPLGVVRVGMLGIGVAERAGAIGALLKLAMLVTPERLLTPAMIFLGIMSSMALDAGYVVLPPIAAALFKSVGRSPLVGIASVFVGVSAGFSANLFITGLDPLLAGFSTEGAQILDSDYQVAATSNYWFMIVSTVLLTGVGWAVTAWFVEPRYANNSAELGGPSALTEEEAASGHVSPEEKRGLAWAGATFLFFFVVIILLINPGPVFETRMPLQGEAGPFPRWVKAIVPLLFFCFLLPGLAYGIAAKTIKSDHDVARMMAKTMADMAPYIVLAFFAAQFVALFKESNLGAMLAIKGGSALSSAEMPPWLLIVAFILLVMVANLFIGSASAKYAFFAPVFVPMFMTGAGISPELTQAAYRVGDSCSNIITPLNPYVVIILVFMQKYMPKGGIGTLVALMLPYAVVFSVVWIALILIWMSTGLEMGPAGPLWYDEATGK